MRVSVSSVQNWKPDQGIQLNGTRNCLLKYFLALRTNSRMIKRSANYVNMLLRILFGWRRSLFATSLLGIIHILLDQTRYGELRMLGCQTLFEFVINQVGLVVDWWDLYVQLRWFNSKTLSFSSRIGGGWEVTTVTCSWASSSFIQWFGSWAIFLIFQLYLTM